MRIRLATEGRISEPVGAICADICFMVNRDGRITSEHTHEDCIEFGFTPAELDAAEAGGGEWIDCPRDEEPYDSPARALVNICKGVAQVATETLQEKLNAVTAERDTLLEVCHGAHNISQNILDNLVDRDKLTLLQLALKVKTICTLLIGLRDNAQAAIAIAEPKEVTPLSPGAGAG